MEIPNCAYEDTVNLTGAKRFPNGSYAYEGVIIPPQLTGHYDYEILHGGEHEKVEPHVRGCACKIRACVKFCCHPKQMKKFNERSCGDELQEEVSYDPFLRITKPNGLQQTVHALEDFVIQQGIPCRDAYVLSALEYEEDDWQLFENGTLLRMFDMAYLSKRDYCFTPHEINGSYTLNPMNCPEIALEVVTKLNTWAMIISVPFFLVTIGVYLSIPQLRSLHGKCLISYLSSLAIGYTFIIVITFTAEPFSVPMCNLTGFSAYYFLIAAFFWLSVISYDLWVGFGGGFGKQSPQEKRFNLYCLYAWGVPAIFTALTITAQHSNLDDALKPGIGEEFCWLKTYDWSAMLYFYGPNFLLILFNISMFILTLLQAIKMRKQNDAPTRYSRSQKDNFWLYLRLFTIMGLLWILEVASYMAGGSYIALFYVSDLCNASQGVIIFVLFVLRKQVLTLIKHRICSGRMISHASSSTKSELSNEEISLRAPMNVNDPATAE